MVRGKTIQLFLIDGEPKGRIKCTLANWTEAVVFTTTNNSFGPTEISYLENQFYLMATQNKRFIVKNNLEPTIGNVTEEKESELQEFIDYAKIVIGTLGYKIFEPLLSNGDVDRTTQPGSDEVLFFFFLF